MNEPARPHLSHWGAFRGSRESDGTLRVQPWEADPDPSPILDNIAGAVHHPTRISQPMVRQGWLAEGPGPSARRGVDPFVPVDWDHALQLLAGELGRVRDVAGNAAIYAGSYGWASAGRFHHAQSQLHRFLNGFGGYVGSRNTYSIAAGEVLLPRVLGSLFNAVGSSPWPEILEHTDVWLCLGGVPLKNTAVNPGGVARHDTRERLRAARAAGIDLICISPLRDDLLDEAGGEWVPISPGTDVALLLAIAHVLLTTDAYDREFVERYCAGFSAVRSYVLGDADGVAKTPVWAEAITGVSALTIHDLTRRLIGRRALISSTWSLQRSEHGEQKPWAALTLAALLGQIGLPGGGFGFGYGSMQMVGAPGSSISRPTLPQGENPVADFIPVARIADMLLNPAAGFSYDGQQHTYPDIRRRYWAGGNPYHHHPGIPKLRRAWQRPQTVVVHEAFWTATARRADIVLPVTMTVERNDLGAPPEGNSLLAMPQIVAPYGQARDDYAIFSDLSAALGFAEAFTEGRDEKAWLEALYAGWRAEAVAAGHTVPDFHTFWSEGWVDLPAGPGQVRLAEFRADPDAHRLPTASGRIEIGCAAIAELGLPDCPGHASWLPPTEWLGSDRAQRFPLLLVANNPATRLHSQLDVGGHSQGSKVAGREPIRLHPSDAAARGISAGDVVRVFNDRGSCLAGAVLSEAVRPQVVQLSTGAWYDPLDPADPDAMCVHGNVNVLTPDLPASGLSQGNVGQHTLVQIERWARPLPPLHVLDPPPSTPSSAGMSGDYGP